MKQIVKLSVLVLVAMLLGIPTTQAQDNPMMQPLPVDSDVRIGKLPNGLTYYIRHNENPKGQADFYIAQKVGSILEEDNQRGLAHFLEHMCFNGTTHFPDNSLRDWLESVGVKFGYNLNAYTGIDNTVYLIKDVPIARESVQDSCLLILHDWANDLTLAPEEIDKERGVIHEEWRRSNVGQMRILERILPELFPGTKYGHRLPIGTMEVVDNFPYQALRDYYEAWYRPDQQAVIVVGDIDVDRIEGKIKEMFSNIEMPANAPERVYEPIPDHTGTLYGIGSDPEQQRLIGQIMFISDPTPDEMKNTVPYLIQEYAQEMIESMLENRLKELSSRPDAPFAGASVGFSDYIVAKTKDAFEGYVVASGTDIIEPMKALYRELLRAQRGGFTHSEYDRARAEFLSSLEQDYNNRATRESNKYVEEYVDNFTDGEPIPGIEARYKLFSMMAPMLPVDLVNQLMAELVTPDNRAIIIMSPEGEGYTLPSSEQIEAALSAVDAETIEAFVDEVKSEPLIPTPPVAGSIKSEEESSQWGATIWTLSNGAKVIIKKTAFKDDEILVGAFAKGGYAAYPAEWANTIITLPLTLRANGLGTYSNTDLDKYTAGKQVELNLSLREYSRSINGSTTPKDLSTLMELLYMTFTDLEFTPDEFEAMQKAYAGVLANQEKSPEYLFQKFVTADFYGSPFKQTLTSETILGTSREETIELAHAMTANAADWTFVFVGNVDIDALRPLVETYIASLPSDEAKAVKEYPAFDPTLYVKAGTEVTTHTIPMETPQTQVIIYGTADMEYTPRNSMLASIAGQILSNRLLKTVREDMGAVYSIGAVGQASRNGLNPFMLATQFPMKPEMKEQVLDFIYSQFKAMESDVTAEELNPAKEYMVKQYTSDREKNTPWKNAIIGWVTNGVDTFNGNIETVSAITVDDVKDYMKTFNAAGNLRTVVLDPETK